MTTLTLTIGGWALYAIGYSIGKAQGYDKGYDRGIQRSWHLYEGTLQKTLDDFRKRKDAE